MELEFHRDKHPSFYWLTILDRGVKLRCGSSSLQSGFIKPCKSAGSVYFRLLDSPDRIYPCFQYNDALLASPL